MGTEWFVIPGVYTLLCAVYIIFGLQVQLKPVKMLLKCAPIIFLLTMVLMEVAQMDGPYSMSEQKRTFSKLIWGLVFSGIGDAYLVVPGYFVFGLISFAIAQGIYIKLFDPIFPASISDPTQTDYTIAIGVATVSLAVYFYVFPKLSKVLKVAAAAYCVLISVMLWRAIARLQYEVSDVSIMGAVGACMFYTSDLLLAVTKWRLEIPASQLFIMTTYYSAQFFIAGSVFDGLF